VIIDPNPETQKGFKRFVELNFPRHPIHTILIYLARHMLYKTYKDVRQEMGESMNHETSRVPKSYLTIPPYA
jgi:hypothetical protein